MRRGFLGGFRFTKPSLKLYDISAMSLSHQGGRKSWRVLSQLRKSSFSSLPRSPSAHLGLQQFRLHGISVSSSSGLHHFYSSPSFSTAAEAAHMANSADPEAISPVDSVSEKHEAASSSAMASKLNEEQELTKMLEEHRDFVSSLRAELEDQKTFRGSILDEIRILKLSAHTKAADSAESKIADKKQPYLEWAAFMEHLQSSKYFEDENEESSSDSSSVFDDPTCVKRAIYKFSRAHESVFESLSLIDLRIIARHGSSANDPKASAAQKRLCQFFHLEDLSSDAGAAKPASTQPKLSDVIRLLYSTVLEGTYGDDVKSSISHLLREIVTFSKRPSVAPAVPLPAIETSRSSKLGAALSMVVSDMSGQLKQEKEKELKKERGDDIAKIGTAKQEPVKVAAKADARPDTSVGAPQWKCPRCSFMNLDTKHRCVECSRRRPQRTYGSDTVQSTDDVSCVEEVSDVKVPEGRQAKKANERKTKLPSQGRENLKDCSSSSAIQEQDTADVEVSSSDSDIGSEGSEAFRLLDEILDSEDLSDEQQEKGKIAGLSDDSSEKEQQGEGKRASLANLFPMNKPRSSSRRGGQRDSEKRNGNKGGDRYSKNKRFEDDDDNGRYKHGSVGKDSEDDDSLSHRSRRGFNSQGDDYSRNRGRGGYDSFRGRGGRRGSGGGRGDSFDSRHNDGALRGGSAYGERDGGRSSNWGSRPSRGKPRF